ncbi:MAG: (E)-4-hydroxy-3-methylbut-2-enyl-diphosphate synthase [candidate division KSB1 bacterium]|nr:(E)-4-hydroxy-3-methylbut-2-enyl-diphosphate synthase [candidate division KSB1 bacterium]MDZ7276403.1 (E)-4-hydroxy-3-methylbut-2-enyl-diphosphate synthase [candidate division KSB1 bacterium]MDZ7288074.1 (E)-4-hydroxy-3-methylbut-2-enyl-diphosphate synthase [candidate division KSB1 bacterium]MDZ7300174.1 (E)-4-hydroxy-3-methylbut-2-enyl-diphosphate synthase [candidate division KSB1 bacterium]MDZ7351175.1 (E)-4-hydroxy-3-methylbut-2-enyl-diphosphate synthase [candidate division KSB1 bacterium
MTPLPYCEHPFFHRRRPTHEVKVGDLGIGGNNPIRVQSMTISDTMDTAATVKETIQLYEAGCEIVRITAPSLKEAENLRAIKAGLRRQNIRVPLVADIHYTPNAALVAAEIVEKVRINPGNYADKKKFEMREYTDAEYQAELERIAERFTPLVKKCRANGVAMRIGVNHGSLSDRIMNRYGDTPEGMVQSALEFIRICEAHGYRDIVVSMKSSNPQVMIQAYRLLAARMYELGMTYPFHLGVTEAGDGEDGRIKSAVGIGALLEDGLGDTIRVSLTEDSIYEIPVARALVRKFNAAAPHQDVVPAVVRHAPVSPRDYAAVVNPFVCNRRATQPMTMPGLTFGGREPVRVGISLAYNNVASEEVRALVPPAGFGKFQVLGAPAPPVENFAEWLETGSAGWDLARTIDCLPLTRQAVPLAAPWQNVNGKPHPFIVLLPMAEASAGTVLAARQQAQQNGGHVQAIFTTDMIAAGSAFAQVDLLQRLLAEGSWSIGVTIPGNRLGQVGLVRMFVTYLARLGVNVPLVWRYQIPAERPQESADWMLDASSQLGALLCDGLGDALIITGAIAPAQAARFSYNLLQATRLRISKTEFISCPSCGRTLFNLQTTTERIKAKTGHLKGVKIAIMGCIVNGPGEMADADFGYVGTGQKVVSLYVGKECVQRNIPEEEADERLIALIKAHGKWVEPAGAEQPPA